MEPTVAVTPTVTTTTVIPQTVAPSMPSTVQYAGFGSRLLASLIDGIILMVIGFVFGFVVGFALGLSGSSSKELANTIVRILSYVISFSYYIYFIGAKGQTPGKMAMGIKVVKVADNSVPGYVSAFLREVVGKTISAVVLLLGFFWMLWDAKKQTWHDKIASTIVVKVNPTPVS